MTYLYDSAAGRKYAFSGVTSVKHSLTSKVNTDSNMSMDAETVFTAVNEADRITLTAVCSDTDGEPARLFAELRALKESFTRLTLVSPLETLSGLILTEVTAVTDSKAPNGWTATIVLRRVPQNNPTPTGGNTSQPEGKGTASKKTVTLQQLKDAGLQLTYSGKFEMLK